MSRTVVVDFPSRSPSWCNYTIGTSGNVASERRNSAAARAAIERSVLEVLEGRKLLSSVTFADGVLTIDGSADQRLSANVDLSGDGSRIRVFATGNDAQSFAKLQVKSINIVGSPGDDRIRIANRIKIAAHIQGGDGDDKITGGGGDDTIDGGAGNDSIRGRSGNDEITGDAGNDDLAGDGGNDTLDGGDGDDRLTGGRGADELTGNAGRDLFLGGAGNDEITDLSIEDRGGRVIPPAKGPDVGDTPDLPPTDDSQDDGSDSSDDSGSNDSGDDDSSGGDSSGDDSGSDSGSGSDNSGPDSGNPGDNSNQSDDPNAPLFGGTFDPSLATGPAPTPFVQFISSQRGVAGHAVHVDGLASHLYNGDAIGAKFEWDFGDAGSEYNRLIGWNAAHVYDKPGTYTLKLTVTDAGGKSATRSETVTITADNRRTIYVDSSASDSNDGSSPAEAVKTLARAVALAGNDTRILLKRGETFEVSDSLRVTKRNITVDAFGTSKTAPVVKKVKGLGFSLFYISPTATGFAAQNLALDSMWGLNSVYGKQKVPAEAFTVTADNVTIRNCSFNNITTGVQTASGPKAVLVQDNYFTPNIRAYCIWAQGTDHVYLGNTMTGSQQEHLIRSDGTQGTGVSRVLIHDNDFSRPSNRKGSLEMRTSTWFYISGNRINGGSLRVGLQDVDKHIFPDWAKWKTENGVVENNIVKNVYINVRPGTHHLAIRNNVVQMDNSWGIQLENIEAGYDQVRKTDDVRITNNTVINNATSGSLLRLHGHATNITLTNNLFIAPHLKLDGSDAFGVDVTDHDLSAFKVISQNIWPSLNTTSKQDGLNYIGSEGVSAWGFKSANEWESLPQVKGDIYRNVALSTNGYSTRVGGFRAGSTLQKAA
jgi:PKD repeat protein